MFNQPRPKKVHTPHKGSILFIFAGDLEEGGPDGKPRCFQGKLVTPLRPAGVTWGSAVLYCGGGEEQELKRNIMTCSIAPAQALSCSSYVLANAIVRTIEMLTRGVHCLCQKITALFLRASSFRVKHHEEESTAPPGSYMLYILKKKNSENRRVCIYMHWWGNSN